MFFNFFLAVVLGLLAAPVSAGSPPPGMVLVPAGDFVMGTDEVDERQEALMFGLPHPWYEDEHPRRRLHLPAFYIDRYEVTRAEYEKFVRATGHSPPPDWRESSGPSDRADFPVTHVSWHDARDYCAWKGERLPTEAEWEKAARGPDGQRYPWGDRFDPARANLASRGTLFGHPVAVGQYEGGQSPYGVHDLIGNVWEWTDSWYLAYPGNSSGNENFDRRFKVNRGLSFMRVGHYPPDLYDRVASIVARASFRSYDVPSARLPDLGFRCAQSAG